MCVVAKVLERCIYHRLIGHIENMISGAQHGFLRGRSSTSHLLSVLHRISQDLDSGKQMFCTLTLLRHLARRPQASLGQSFWS